jgi:hypothetical protein
MEGISHVAKFPYLVTLGSLSVGLRCILTAKRMSAFTQSFDRDVRQLLADRRRYPH